jgi:AraC family transcriptional regulator
MHSQTFRNRPHLPFGVPAQLKSSDIDDNRHPFYEEKSWRCLANTENDRTSHAGILVSRWIGTSAACRHEKAEPSSSRHVIGVSLKTTQVKLTRGTSTVFDGSMPAGTLHITGPGQPLTAEFRAPCDFVHFHVSSDYLRECQEVARSSQAEPIPELNDLIVRDPLAEMLGKTLVESGTAGDDMYVESVAQTLVMHVARLEPPRHSVNPLPKWRMKRVQEYVRTHLEKCISLAEFSKAAGLSPMHFAAQFRAATGFRPHEYLLQQRIESAKDILSTTDMALAEVALALGFHAQAHFSTVFKKLTGETPARWRKSHRAGTTPAAENSRRPHGIARHHQGII